MLGELARQVEADGGLDFAAGDGVLLVVVGEARGLGGHALEDVVDERVHDAHGLAGDARVGVHLLEHLVDVDGVRLLAALALLLVVARRLGLDGLLLALLGSNLARHLGLFVASRENSRNCAVALRGLKFIPFRRIIRAG